MPKVRTAHPQVTDDVLYYLWLPRLQVVKIGTSRVLKTRLATHRRELDREIGLLALEPGDRMMERVRHQEWRSQWLGGPRHHDWGSDELFAARPALLTFADQVRGTWVARHPEHRRMIGWSTVAPRHMPPIAALLGLR